jgi:translation initiation factor IF-2
MSLAAPSQGPATATVVETSMGRSGPQATVIVRRGRLRVGDALLVGTEYGKVGRKGGREGGGAQVGWLTRVQSLAATSPG